MKIVILGAGASYDSINRFHDEYHEAHKWRPPLGNDIFGARQNFRDIYDKYPGAKAYSHAINSGNDIEDFFQKKWELATEKNDKYTLANIINTQYCLQELFYEISKHYSQNIGVSNYHVLIHQAYDYHLQTGEDVVFITFNYDLLLEYALVEYFNEGNEITLETYTKYPIKIFKPHGSCNWFKCSENVNNEFNRLMSRKPSYEEITAALEEDIVVSDYPLLRTTHGDVKYPIFHFGKKALGSGAYRHTFPQLLIPIKTKDEFIMSIEHLALMKKYLKECTEMLVIGWKGQEEHFLTTLNECCENNKIEATFVTCKDVAPFKVMKKRMPKLSETVFVEPYYESFIGAQGIKLAHIEGSFSSYILNVTKKGEKGFFDVNAEKI